MKKAIALFLLETFRFPFEIRLPLSKGAKGSWKGKQGVIRYIAIGSIKLKAEDGSDNAIAHFYRDVDVLPYLNPALVLAPSFQPITSKMAKPVFMGGSGNVELTASLHRSTWVAGQKCYVEVTVANNSTRKIKTLTIAVIRTTSIFNARTADGSSSMDPANDAELDSVKKKVAESTLEMGKKGAKGSVTAKGSWIGVEKGEKRDFLHSIMLPADAITMPRGKYFEVNYSLKVTVGGSMTSEVSTEIPIRIINFVSLDPPPGHIGEIPSKRLGAISRCWSIDDLANRTEDTMEGKPSRDTLRLSDLNENFRSNRLLNKSSRVTFSEDSFRMEARERRMRHQMSLDVIGAAMAGSARKMAFIPSPGRESSQQSQLTTLSPVDLEGASEGEAPELYGTELDFLLGAPDSDVDDRVPLSITPKPYSSPVGPLSAPASPTIFRRPVISNKDLAAALSNILSDDDITPQKTPISNDEHRQRDPMRCTPKDDFQLTQTTQEEDSQQAKSSLTRSKAIGSALKKRKLHSLPRQMSLPVFPTAEGEHNTPIRRHYLAPGLRDCSPMPQLLMDEEPPPFDLEDELLSCLEEDSMTHASSPSMYSNSATAVSTISRSTTVPESLASSSSRKSMLPISSSVRMRIAALESNAAKSKASSPTPSRVRSIRSSASSSSLASATTSSSFRVPKVVSRGQTIKRYNAPLLQ
ncbi:hypothetical protein BT69DRAFT_1371213 [Atractiella rhizophila]|nr:hypothetical protein BT69DRAFT_1371213 [Atractiella rhizophila]